MIDGLSVHAKRIMQMWRFHAFELQYSSLKQQIYTELILLTLDWLIPLQRRGQLIYQFDFTMYIGDLIRWCAKEHTNVATLDFSVQARSFARHSRPVLITS